MALFCSRCGAQNPDGSAFCSRCGAPLAATAVTPPGAPPGVTPSPGVPPPPVPAPAPGAPYVPGQSAYLPPPPGGTAVHNTSRNVVIAVVVVAVVVIAGAAVAFAALSHGTSTPVSHPSSPPVPTSHPTAHPTTQPTLRPTTAPTVQPTAGPTNGPTPSGGSTVNAGFATVFVPQGWTTSNAHSNYIELDPPSRNGLIIVESDPQPSGATNAGLDQALLKADQQNYDPAAAACPGTTTQMSTLSGSAGVISADLFAICENVTPQNGPAFAAIDAYVDGIAQGSSGLKSAIINVFAPADQYTAFLNTIPARLFTDTVFKDAGPP
jgi:hypothetical protein